MLVGIGETLSSKWLIRDTITGFLADLIASLTVSDMTHIGDCRHVSCIRMMLAILTPEAEAPRTWFY